MKNIVIFLFGALLLNSCDMTEKIYLDNDGNVSYAMEFDMAQMGQMIAMSEKQDDEFPIDTIMTLQELQNSDSEFTKGMGEGLSETGDEELFKDFKFHIKMDETESFMSMFLEKKPIAEFNNYMNEFNKKMKAVQEKKQKEAAQENTDDLGALADKFGSNSMFFDTKLNLSFDGKTFKRSGELKMENPMKNAESEEEKMEGMMMGMMTYKLEYHFPRPVKTISDTTVLMSWDRKTIYLEKPMNQLLKNSKAYNFEVTLED